MVESNKKLIFNTVISKARLPYTRGRDGRLRLGAYEGKAADRIEPVIDLNCRLSKPLSLFRKLHFCKAD